jgi:ankyrin repeat protein
MRVLAFLFGLTIALPASAQIARQKRNCGAMAACMLPQRAAISPTSKNVSRPVKTQRRSTLATARRCMSRSTRRGMMPRALIRLGADPNKLEIDRYDIITIAAVANDVPMLRIAIEGGGNARAITSRYDGTALIAAAHLGHAEVVRMLIGAKAPLDHVNNLKWTALIESIVLGDGGRNHTETLRALVEAGADVNIPDGNGSTPLKLAQGRGYREMVAILEMAGAK